MMLKVVSCEKDRVLDIVKGSAEVKEDEYVADEE